MDPDFKHPENTYPGHWPNTTHEQNEIERRFDVKNNVGHPNSEYAQMSRIHRVTAQPLRSIGDWSLGLEEENIEFSIMNAYHDMIEKAEKFIYIENQYFISNTTGYAPELEDTPLKKLPNCQPDRRQAGVVRYVKHRIFCTACFFGKISTAKSTSALLR